VKLRQRWGTLRALAELAAMSFRADAVAAAVTATAQPFDLAGGVLQALALKGLAEPLVSCEVSWQPRGWRGRCWP
jgi:hypothetical protein